MKGPLITCLGLSVVSLLCGGAEAAASTNVVFIGQPSIFWRNGEWQTYKDGVWTPYGKTPDTKIDPGNQENGTGILILSDGTPVYLEPFPRRGHEPGGGERHFDHQRDDATGKDPTMGLGQPNIGIGQTTIGIGQPNVSIGQGTIGIGRPNAGMGQPNGIGQTTIGIGQQTSGLGQPNDLGKTTIDIGKPAGGLPPLRR